MASGRCLEHLRGHQGPIWSMQFDGARLASCDDEGVVRLWDLGSHRQGTAAVAGRTEVCAWCLPAPAGLLALQPPVKGRCRRADWCRVPPLAAWAWPLPCSSAPSSA